MRNWLSLIKERNGNGYVGGRLCVTMLDRDLFFITNRPRLVAIYSASLMVDPLNNILGEDARKENLVCIMLSSADI